ncbi:MAG TPA: DNA polymerase III subunit delta [Tepidisphaeraceae bacterium]|nr:DNA polymerase III subunit delta [Tepidisphaeraceae bacterium]
MSKPIYALVGDDNFLQTQKLAAIIGTLPAGVQRSDFDGQSAELADVLDELRSFAMFGPGKLVTVRNADDFVSRFREQMENYVSQPAENSTLILRFASLPKTQRIYKLIDKVGTIEPCTPPTAGALPGWIQKHAQSAYAIQLQSDAAQLLAELIGTDLGRIDSELAKLAILAKPSQKVAASDLVGQVAFQREREMWDLTNALAEGNSADAIRRWRQLLQSDSSTEFRAVTWLTIWLDDVRHVIDSQAAGQRPDFKKLWRYKGDQLKRFLANCDRLGPSGLNRTINALVQTDRQNKSGIGDASTNIERFILDLAQTA